MEANKLGTLPQYRDAMVDAAPWTQHLLDTLRRDGFTLTQVRHPRGPTWFVWVSPPPEVQAGFGLAPELLLVLVHGMLQAVDLHAAAEEVVTSDLRLDGNLMVVCDREGAPLQGRLDRLGGVGRRVAWSPAFGDQWPLLRDVLRVALPTFDA